MTPRLAASERLHDDREPEPGAGRGDGVGLVGARPDDLEARLADAGVVAAAAASPPCPASRRRPPAGSWRGRAARPRQPRRGRRRRRRRRRRRAASPSGTRPRRSAVAPGLRVGRRNRRRRAGHRRGASDPVTTSSPSRRRRPRNSVARYVDDGRTRRTVGTPIMTARRPRRALVAYPAALPLPWRDERRPGDPAGAVARRHPDAAC